MNAFQIEAFGLDGLVQRELATPEPGFGQVLVEVKATSLNYRDLLMVKGHYDKNMPLPLIPLSDGAGVVSEIGPGVTHVKVGDRVAGSFFQSWIEGPYNRSKSRLSLGGPRPGMLSTHVVLDELGAVPIPAGLSFEEAATLPCAGVTAWNALFSFDPIKPGDTVLVQGTGGVSMFALQFAVAAGARVIATSSSHEKLERAVALGAFATVNYRSTPNWGSEVRNLSDGGVDCVVEVGGAGTLKQSMDAVRYGGRTTDRRRKPDPICTRNEQG
jgi:NADPH:quinone reductase-like Zn-dependent oxidoreductase